MRKVRISWYGVMSLRVQRWILPYGAMRLVLVTMDGATMSCSIIQTVLRMSVYQMAICILLPVRRIITVLPIHQAVLSVTRSRSLHMDVLRPVLRFLRCRVCGRHSGCWVPIMRPIHGLPVVRLTLWNLSMQAIPLMVLYTGE